MDEQEVQGEGSTEGAVYEVGPGDGTPPVQPGCADQDLCYRSIEAAVERFEDQAKASEGYKQYGEPKTAAPDGPFPYWLGAQGCELYTHIDLQNMFGI